MAFTKKPNAPVNSGNNNSDIDPSDWIKWGEYQHNLIGDEEYEEKGKFKRKTELVGVVNFLMDLGYQPQPDGKYDTKCALPEGDEEYSAEEIKYMEEHPNSDFIWDYNYSTKKKERKQTSPNRPEEEVVVCIDFPEVMVDYSKHPMSTEDNNLGEKPLRISLNGRFKDTFNRHITLRLNKDKQMSDKNLLYKIADKAGVLKQFIDSGYDLATLAGVSCKWSVISEKNVVSDDKIFYNIIAKDPTAITEVKVGGKVVATVEDQIPECPTEFCGILLHEGEYPVENLRQIRKEHLTVAQNAISWQPSPDKHPDFYLGVNWEDSDLKKALDKMHSETSDKPVEQSKPKAEQPVKEEVKAAPEPVQEPEDDGFEFDQDIPFIDPYRRTLKISHCI